MKICVCGSRIIKRFQPVEAALNEFFAQYPQYKMTLLVTGREPKGVDRLSEHWAIQRGIPVDPHPADWDRWGLSAGPRRNAEMAEIIELLIAIKPLGMETKGTNDMISKAKAKNVPVFELRVVP